MNPTTTSVDPTAPPPPPPLQPPRSSFSCDRHPTEQFTGFCPSCLCERLTTLDQSSSNTPSSSRRPSSASAAAAAAIKSLFSSTSKPNIFPPPPPKPSKPTSIIPELRRTKSFSASKNEALGLSFEPQRKSCDVRVRNTLSTLFTLDESSKTVPSIKTPNSIPALASSSLPNCKNPEPSAANKPVFEEIENEEEFRDPIEDGIAFVDDDGDEIRAFQDSHLEGLRNSVDLKLNSGEIVEEEGEEEEEELTVTNSKPMKDHIDQEKKSSGGGLWAAASVFSKKWNNWRRKQKMKKQNNGENLATLPVEKPISRQFRETQSEIADYGFGRRSCDTDPRFSLDAGRISFDDPRYSFEEPRASWDGYLIGRSFPRMAPMVSVLEDPPTVAVPRHDMQIPVEEPPRSSTAEEEGAPGGSLQTRDYYLDSSSSRRRKSLDRSSSIRKTAAAVVAEIDELKMASNAKVSPATTECFHGAKVLVDSNANSMRDDLSETFELSSGIRDINSVVGNGDRKEAKKAKRWSWKLWGFIQKRNGGNGNKDDYDDEKYSRVNGVERSLSESWPELRRENGEVRGGLNRAMFRSNSSVSWRNANHFGGSIGSARKSNVETHGNWFANGNGNGEKKNEFVLEKNRSARYSPNHFDNGLLRFYLTPMRGSRRGGMSKVKPSNSQSIARSVLRLY